MSSVGCSSDEAVLDQRALAVSRSCPEETSGGAIPNQDRAGRPGRSSVQAGAVSLDQGPRRWRLGAWYQHRLPAGADRLLAHRATTGASQEARLNALPQFKARIDDADVHFVHAKGRGADPMPLLLLLTAGPTRSSASTRSSRLRRESSDCFDLVVPSLPGFPFTGPSGRRPRAADPAERRAVLAADDRSARLLQRFARGRGRRRQRAGADHGHRSSRGGDRAST